MIATAQACCKNFFIHCFMYHRPYTRAGASVTILASIFDHHDNEFLVESRLD